MRAQRPDGVAASSRARGGAKLPDRLRAAARHATSQHDDNEDSNDCDNAKYSDHGVVPRGRNAVAHDPTAGVVEILVIWNATAGALPEL